MIVLLTVCSILSVLMALPALVVSIYTLIEFKAMQKSTHKIEYMPIPVPEVNPKEEKEFKESFNEDYNDKFII
jgi:hypothetical protein